MPFHHHVLPNGLTLIGEDHPAARSVAVVIMAKLVLGSWGIKSTGDFNADGSADLLWQNSSGDVAIWELSGATVIASGSARNPGPSWHAIGTGDFWSWSCGLTAQAKSTVSPARCRPA